jgi:hypothetical protein
MTTELNQDLYFIGHVIKKGSYYNILTWDRTYTMFSCCIESNVKNWILDNSETLESLTDSGYLQMAEIIPMKDGEIVFEAGKSTFYEEY